MELTFYDVAGEPIAYCEDGRYLYAFNGTPLAYLDADSIISFSGHHLGWWNRGWVRDHDGHIALFTDSVAVANLPLPAWRPRPAKEPKAPLPGNEYKRTQPDRVPALWGWSVRSGAHFFFCL